MSKYRIKGAMYVCEHGRLAYLQAHILCFNQQRCEEIKCSVMQNYELLLHLAVQHVAVYCECNLKLCPTEGAMGAVFGCAKNRTPHSWAGQLKWRDGETVENGLQNVNC